MNEKRRHDEASDKAFAGRIAQAFTPPEMTTRRRSTIDASVRARTEGGDRFRRRGFGLVLTGATAAALAAFALRGLPGPDSNPELSGEAPRTSVAQPQLLAAAPSPGEVTWTDTLLFAPAEVVPDSETIEELPADYRAITDVWLDG